PVQGSLPVGFNYNGGRFVPSMMTDDRCDGPASRAPPAQCGLRRYKDKLSRGAGGATDCRTTSSCDMTATSVGVRPAISARRLRAAAVPISANGIRTVVSGGSTYCP